MIVKFLASAALTGLLLNATVGAAPAAAGDGVEGGEALVDADGVVGAEDRDGGAEADALGAGGDGGEHDFGGADGEVGAVVLADPKEVDTEAVG